MENSLSPDVKNVRKRLRILAAVLAFSVCTNILFITYAYLQQKQALQAEMQAIKAKQEAIVQMDIAQQRLKDQTEQTVMLRDSLTITKSKLNSLKSKGRK